MQAQQMSGLNRRLAYAVRQRFLAHPVLDRQYTRLKLIPD